MTVERVFPREAMTAERRDDNGSLPWHLSSLDYISGGFYPDAAFRPATDLDDLIAAAGNMIGAIVSMQAEGFEVPFGLIVAARELQSAWMKWDGDQ